MENNFNKDFQEGEGFDFKSFFINCVRYWYLFVLSLLLCFVYAFYSVTYTSPIFRIESRILIDDNGGKSSQRDLLDLDMFGSKKNIENELEILKSRTLISKVIDKLNFDVSYFWIGNVTVNELYDKTPFLVKSDSIATCNGAFEMTILDQNSFKLKHDYAGNSVFEGKYFFGEIIKSPSGEFAVYKSDFFNSRNFGDSNLKAKSRNFKFVFNDRERTINKYLGGLWVELVGKRSSVVNLSIDDQVQQKGVDFLNALIEEYRNQGVNNKNEVALNTLNFIKERLEYITEDLSVLETDIEQFKSLNRITSLGEESKIFLSNVSKYDSELSLVTMKLNLMDNLQKKIKLNQTLNDYSPSLIGIDDPLLQKLVMQLSELEFQREKLVTTSKTQSPLVFTSNVDVQIKKTKAAIGESINKIQESLLISQGDLKSIISKQEDFIRAIPKVSRELISIERQQEIKEKLYLYLLEKQEELALTQASTVSDCRVIDKAISTGSPVKPVKKMAYSIALFIGLFAPLLFVILRMYLNDKVNDKSDIEKATKAPILGFISQGEGDTNVVVGENTRTAISEQFRALRTNLNFLGLGKRHKFILVTSSMSGEGKTFVATNIASTMALSGKKTVVLEFDLRKPKMSKGLGYDNSVGLSNYLVGRADLDSIIKNTKISPNLFLISSGAIPPNPSELILTDKMKELMDILDERFDFVVIDSPPVGLVSDALVLNEYADSSLYIVRQNKTTKKHLEIIDELYKENKLNNLAVLLNGVVKVIGKYGYEYGYYEEGYADKSLLGKIKRLFFKK